MDRDRKLWILSGMLAMLLILVACQAAPTATPEPIPTTRPTLTPVPPTETATPQPTDTAQPTATETSAPVATVVDVTGEVVPIESTAPTIAMKARNRPSGQRGAAPLWSGCG